MWDFRGIAVIPWRAVRAMMLNVVPQGAAWALQGQEAVIMLIGWCVRESANVVPYRVARALQVKQEAAIVLSKESIHESVGAVEGSDIVDDDLN